MSAQKKTDIERAPRNVEPGVQPCELVKNILEKGSWPLCSAAEVPRNQKHPQIPLISTKQRDCNYNLSREGGKQSEKIIALKEQITGPTIVCEK